MLPIKLLGEVLREIMPSKEEYRKDSLLAHTIVAKLRRAAPPGCSVVLTGSVAKLTFLKNERDFDIFILFPRNIQKKDFEGLTRQIVKRALPGNKIQTGYAEHPYINIILDGINVDVVPAYRIRDAREMKSAVDRSVLHTKYILRNLKKKQIGDVLLLKKFLKANGLYGAEIRVHGFSGYLCELLVIQYRSFFALLQNFSKLKLPWTIDLESHYDKPDYGKLVRRFKSELVVIDPIDKNRNVSAAVSGANLRKLIMLSRQFIRKPGKKFFIKKELCLAEILKKLKKKKGALYLLEFQKPNVVEDILWGQLHKLAKNIRNGLEQKGFEVSDLLIHEEKSLYLMIQVSNPVLSSTMLLEGPELKRTENVRQFRKAHKGAKFVSRNRRICAKVTRKVQTAEIALRSFFRQKASLPSHFIGLKVRMKKYKNQTKC